MTTISKQQTSHQERRTHLCARRRALTLVEVMAALVILGGAATTMLVAQANNTTQLRQIHLELTATHIASEWLAQWKLEQEDLSTQTGGQVESFDGWSWQVSTAPLEVMERLSARMATLVVSYADPNRNIKPWRRTYRWLLKNEGERNRPQ